MSLKLFPVASLDRSASASLSSDEHKMPSNRTTQAAIHQLETSQQMGSGRPIQPERYVPIGSMEVKQAYLEELARKAIEARDLNALIGIPADILYSFGDLVADLFNDYRTMENIIESNLSAAEEVFSESIEEQIPPDSLRDQLTSRKLTDALRSTLEDNLWSEEELNALMNCSQAAFSTVLAVQIMNHRAFDLLHFLPKSALSSISSKVTERRETYQKMLYYFLTI